MAKTPLITRIHGRYYDLAGFSHPGGCPALECARDRDATELFESYHALHRARPLNTLKSYEIPAEQAQSEQRFLAEARFGPTPFDWERTLASEFRADILESARAYFEEERKRRNLRTIRAATKAPPRRWLEMVILGLLFFGALVPFVRGSWPAMFAVPLLGWIFMVNFWHDALHFAVSRSWRVNAAIPYLFPWFISPKLWMHQHVIGHHVFTNDPRRDPDIRAAPRVLRQNPSVRWCPIHGRQKSVLWLVSLYSLLCLVRNTLRDHVTRLRGWFNDCVPLVIQPRWRRWLHVFGRLAVAASVLVWPFFSFPVGKALAFALIPSLILSELFLIFSQINHVTEVNMAAGQAPSSDWYEAQVRASCSYATGSYFTYIISGALNLQIEHHLLPGVNQYHLFRLSPEIQRICAKHGIPYHTYPSLWAAVRAHFVFMRTLAADIALEDR